MAKLRDPYDIPFVVIKATIDDVLKQFSPFTRSEFSYLWRVIHNRLNVEDGSLFPILAENPDYFGYYPRKNHNNYYVARQ